MFLSKWAQAEIILRIGHMPSSCYLLPVNLHTLYALMYCRRLVQNLLPCTNTVLQRQWLATLIARKYCKCAASPHACFDLEPKWPHYWKLQIRQCPAPPIPVCIWTWVPGEVCSGKVIGSHRRSKRWQWTKRHGSFFYLFAKLSKIPTR